jgi:hypothetical protein
MFGCSTMHAAMPQLHVVCNTLGWLMRRARAPRFSAASVLLILVHWAKLDTKTDTEWCRQRWGCVGVEQPKVGCFFTGAC